MEDNNVQSTLPVQLSKASSNDNLPNIKSPMGQQTPLETLRQVKPLKIQLPMKPGKGEIDFALNNTNQDIVNDLYTNSEYILNSKQV